MFFCLFFKTKASVVMFMAKGLSLYCTKVAPLGSIHVIRIFLLCEEIQYLNHCFCTFLEFVNKKGVDYKILVY